MELLLWPMLLSADAAVHQVAHMGVTSAAVIHQPSYEVLKMFDDLVLLCKGGRTAFCGRQAAVQVMPHDCMTSAAVPVMSAVRSSSLQDFQAETSQNQTPDRSSLGHMLPFTYADGLRARRTTLRAWATPCRALPTLQTSSWTSSLGLLHHLAPTAPLLRCRPSACSGQQGSGHSLCLP